MRFFFLLIFLLIHSHYAKNPSQLSSQGKSQKHEIKELHKRSKAYSSVQNIPEDPYSPSKKYSLIITTDGPVGLDIKNGTKSFTKSSFVENTFIKEKTINVLSEENKPARLKKNKKKSASVLNLSNWQPKKGNYDEGHGILVLKLHEIDFDKLLKNILEKENSKFAKERGSIESLKSEFYDQPKEAKEDIQLVKSHINQRSSEVFSSSGFKIPNTIKSELVNPLRNRSESFPETTDLNLENEISTNKEIVRDTDTNSQNQPESIIKNAENQRKNEGSKVEIILDQNKHETDHVQRLISNNTQNLIKTIDKNAEHPIKIEGSKAEIVLDQNQNGKDHTQQLFSNNTQKLLESNNKNAEHQSKNEGPRMEVVLDQNQHTEDRAQQPTLNLANAKEPQNNSDVNIDKDDYNFLIKQKKTSLKLFDDEKSIKEHPESNFVSHGANELKSAQPIGSNTSKMPATVNRNDAKTNHTEKNQIKVTKIFSDHTKKDIQSRFASLPLLPSVALKSFLSFDHLKKKETVANDAKPRFIKALLASPKRRTNFTNKTTDKYLSGSSQSANTLIRPRVTIGRKHVSKKKKTVSLKKRKQNELHKNNVHSKARKYFYGKHFTLPNKHQNMSPNKHQRYIIARRTLEDLKNKIDILKLRRLNISNEKLHYSNISKIGYQRNPLQPKKNHVKIFIGEKIINNSLIGEKNSTNSVIGEFKSLEKDHHLQILQNSINSSNKQLTENESGIDDSNGEGNNSGRSSGSGRYDLEVSGDDQEPHILTVPKQIFKLNFREKPINEMRYSSLLFKNKNQSSVSFRDEIPRPPSYKKDTLYSVPAISELNHFGYQSFGEPESVEQQYLDVEGLDEKEKHFLKNFLLDENAEEKKYNGLEENKNFANSNRKFSGSNVNSSNISNFSSKFVDGFYGDKDNVRFGDNDALYPDVKLNTGLYGDSKIALLQKIRKKQRERLLILVLQDMVRKKKLERLQNLKERLLTLRRLEESRKKQLSTPTMSRLLYESMSSSSNNHYDPKYKSLLHNEFSNKMDSEDTNLTKSEQQDDYLTPVIGGEMSSNSTQKALYDRTTIGGETKDFRHQQSTEILSPRKTNAKDGSKFNRTIKNEYILGRKRFHLKKKDRWFSTAEEITEFNPPIRQLVLNNMHHESKTINVRHEANPINMRSESSELLSDKTHQNKNLPFISKPLNGSDDGNEGGIGLKNNTLDDLLITGQELGKTDSQQEEVKMNYYLQNNQGMIYSENSSIKDNFFPKDVENAPPKTSTKLDLPENLLTKSMKKEGASQINNESFISDHAELIENSTQFRPEKMIFNTVPTFDKTIDSETPTGLPKKPPSYLFEVLNPPASTPITFYKPTAPYIQRTGDKRQFQEFSFENLPKKSTYIRYSENPILNSLHMHSVQNKNNSKLNETFLNKSPNLLNAVVYGPLEDSVSIPLGKFLEKANTRALPRYSTFFNENNDLKDDSHLLVQSKKLKADISDQSNGFYSLRLNEPHEYVPNYTNEFYSFSSERPTRSPTHSHFYLVTSKKMAELPTSKRKSNDVIFPSPKPFLIRHHDIKSFRNEQGTHFSVTTDKPKHSTKSLFFPTTSNKIGHTTSRLDANKSFATQIHGEFFNNAQILDSSSIDAVMSMEDMYWTDSIEEIENTCKQEKGTSVVVNILAFGDSLTRGYYNKGKNHHPYTMKLQYLLNKLDNKRCFIVENEGRDGEIAFGEMPKRMEQIFNNSKKKFDWVIILGGTNDIYNTKHAGRHSAIELTQNLLSIHNIALHHNCRTVVVTVPEVFCESIELCSDMKQIRETLNENLRNYAFDHKGDVILCDLANMLGRYKNNQKLLAQFFEGGLHLKPLGYETMAKLIFESLKPFFAV